MQRMRTRAFAPGLKGRNGVICHGPTHLPLCPNLMVILVFNSGSSTLKFRLFRVEGAGRFCAVAGGVISGFGEQAQWIWEINGIATSGRTRARDHRQATAWVLERLQRQAPQSIEAIGHRVVHGGEEFTRPARLTEQVIARIDALRTLAPLHNPLALEVIHACREFSANKIPMVAVFDTAFHAAMPEAARHYAVPQDWARTYGIRRFGFHGLAHRSMYERYRRLRPETAAGARVISLQLGNGCSATAIRDGVSIETSMGYTPIEGLIMSTRSGDVDPGVLVTLAAAGISAAELDVQLNEASGLLGLSGTSADMRELLALEAQNHSGARLAIEAFCHRARKYVGAYLAVLGGADAVLFGGGIGEHAPAIRSRICAGMEWCGLRLDAAANAATVGGERRISADGTTPAAYVIAVDEEILIAGDTHQTVTAGSA